MNLILCKSIKNLSFFLNYKYFIAGIHFESMYQFRTVFGKYSLFNSTLKIKVRKTD